MGRGLEAVDSVSEEESKLPIRHNELRGFMKILSQYYGVKVAVILKHSRQDVKVVAGVGLLEVKLQADLGVDTFLMHGDFVCHDVSKDPRFKYLEVVTGIWGMRFVLVKKLFCVVSGESYFLLLADSEPRTLEESPKLVDLQKVAELACAKIHITQIIRTAKAFIPQVNANASVVASLFDNVDHPVVCVCSDLKILSFNEAAHPFVVLPPDGVIGAELKDVFPVHHKICAAIARSMFSGEVTITKTIDIEFKLKEENSGHVYLELHFVPLFNSQGEIFMVAGMACDVTVARKLEQKLEKNLRFNSRGFEEATENFANRSSPVIHFLTDTLVEQKALRSRNNVSYLTVRTWRKPIKAYQIKALKALKRTDLRSCVGIIADEMLAAISAMVGVSSFDGIVAIPCGHSDSDHCLSMMISELLSEKMSIPVVRAFAPRPLKGSSHPKASAKMPPLKLRQEPQGNYLLVDDVATSGRHLEEAVELLRREGAEVMAVAWIGGEKA